jgi:Flp pilus assembly protein CpaB
MAIAGLAAFALNVNLLRSQQAVTMVAVAARPLMVGQEFSADMVRFVEVGSDTDIVSALIDEAEVTALEGRIVTNPIPEGSPLTVDSLTPTATDTSLPRAISIPVAPERAGGGTLRAGEYVDIIAVAGGRARYVVTGVEVVAVPTLEEGRFIATTDYYVMVAVDSDMALRLAEAMEAESIDVVRATGAAPPTRLELPASPVGRGGQEGGGGG